MVCGYHQWISTKYFTSLSIIVLFFLHYYVHSMLLFLLLHKHQQLKRWWSRVEV